MKKKDYVPQIPYGTRDFLPAEAKRKRVIESGLASLFAIWGYDEVVTPTFEYADTIAAGAGQEILQTLFKFIDKDNSILVLRPDMTTPIARMAVSRLREKNSPARLFYITNVFRQEQAQAGRQCEFYQAGVELLGVDGPAADAEVIALAVASMREAGLENFQISLGQVDFLTGIMAETGLEPKKKQQVMQCMVDRDLVGLEEVLAQSGLSLPAQQLLRDIPVLHGREELLEKAGSLINNEQSRAALANLSDIYCLLSSYGVERYVNFDLGIIRDLDYYTGMVFEGYTPGLGFPLCGGGRYNKMLAAFGIDSPATGFALGIERILLALERQGIAAGKSVPGIYIGWSGDNLSAAVQAAQSYRQQGKRAQLALISQSKAAAKASQEQQGYAEIVYFD